MITLDHHSILFDSYLSQLSFNPEGTFTTSGSAASDFSSSPSAVSRLMSGSAPFIWTSGTSGRYRKQNQSPITVAITVTITVVITVAVTVVITVAITLTITVAITMAITNCGYICGDHF
jgi:hypothetical protein